MNFKVFINPACPTVQELIHQELVNPDGPPDLHYGNIIHGIQASEFPDKDDVFSHDMNT